jgi:hypothetical protein
MNSMRFPFERILVATAVIAVSASSVFAGPPLVCWKVETGGGASLPWVDRSDTYQGMDHDYRTSRLAADTLALLKASAPVLERMETLRRAALYAAGDAKAGEALMTGLVERTDQNPSDALAWFDAGYFVEASRQARGKNEPEFWSRFLEAAGIRSNAAGVLGTKTGYDAIAKAIDLSKNDPAIEYAAALVSWYPRRAEHDRHLQRAAAGAAEGSLLAKNLLKHFGDHGRTLADLRANVAVGVR